MPTDVMQGWSNFFVGELGAAAALTGLLFVAVSINLVRILQFSHLPTRAAEALLTLLSVLIVTTFALIRGNLPPCTAGRSARPDFSSGPRLRSP